MDSTVECNEKILKMLPCLLSDTHRVRSTPGGMLHGLYWDNGKENGNYYSLGYIGIMEKKMETTIVWVLLGQWKIKWKLL